MMQQPNVCPLAFFFFASSLLYFFFFLHLHIFFYDFFFFLQVALKASFTFESTLLLTGTPLQNNTEARTFEATNILYVYFV